MYMGTVMSRNKYPEETVNLILVSTYIIKVFVEGVKIYSIRIIFAVRVSIQKFNDFAAH